MNRVCVRFERDWADEFEVYGFNIMDATEWAEFKDKLPELFEKVRVVECNFGTNEGFEFESPEDVLECFQVTYITERDEDSLRRTLCSFRDGWGWTPLEQIKDWMAECEN